jgi:PAS domain S-box-containing protein
MSHSVVQPKHDTTAQAPSGRTEGAAVRCPLPVRPQGLDAVSSDLCDALEQAGCPLAPLVRERLRFETLLASLSATFINLPAGQVDSQIESALQRLVEFLQVDRGGLAEVLGDQKQLVITHSYHAPGAPPNTRLVLNEQLPWYANAISQGEILRFSVLPDDLPPEATLERDYCFRVGLKAHVMIPLKVMGAVVGAIGFGSFRGSRDWPDDLIQHLRLVGEIFTNALARKRADLVIRESEERFRLMAEAAAPVMVWMSGPDKGCTYVNQHWLDFTGRPMDRQIGDGWSEGIHPDDLQRCLQTYCDAFDARRAFRMEYRLERFDGEYRWILDMGAPRFGADGTFLGYIGSCIDINDQKQVEEALRAREQLLRQAREGLRNVAAKLLHAQEEERRRIAREMHDDWTQRLALLGIDMAKLEKHLGAAEKALPLLRTMQEKLLGLSEDMHALSRQLHPGILDDLGLVEALRSECASLSRREGIAIVYRAEEVPTALTKDVALCVYRVAQEALRNLAKHAAVNKAWVSLSATGPELLLRVRDKGVGFDPAEGHSQPGLGLSSMEERVRLIQAKLSVTSAPGRGTTVEVRVPLARSDP